MHFFPSLLFKNDRILRNGGSFSSLNNFKTPSSYIFKLVSHFLTAIRNVEKFNKFYKQIAVVRKREINLKS